MLNLILMDPCIVDYSAEIPTRCIFVIEFIIPKYFNQKPDSVTILTIHFNQSQLYKEYYFNTIIWTTYNIYEIFYLIVVYKPEAQIEFGARNMLSLQ